MSQQPQNNEGNGPKDDKPYLILEDNELVMLGDFSDIQQAIGQIGESSASNADNPGYILPPTPRPGFAQLYNPQTPPSIPITPEHVRAAYAREETTAGPGSMREPTRTTTARYREQAFRSRSEIDLAQIYRLLAPLRSPQAGAFTRQSIMDTLAQIDIVLGMYHNRPDGLIDDIPEAERRDVEVRFTEVREAVANIRDTHGISVLHTWGRADGQMPSGREEPVTPTSRTGRRRSISRMGERAASAVRSVHRSLSRSRQDGSRGSQGFHDNDGVHSSRFSGLIRSLSKGSTGSKGSRPGLDVP
ncbi:hypothetical protein BJ170DRAFT_637791 [Xylariales sp. AK1849]|nr:hypothetical protein BJ170DRAFT_637791 [Xylariales sp. AK1849]